MQKTDVVSLAVGDYFFNKTRNIYGKVTKVHVSAAPKTGYYAFELIAGLPTNFYFYSHEEIYKLENEEITDFDEKFNRNKKYAVLRNLQKPYCFIGSDPEMFIVDEKNAVIPSFDFLKSKEENDLTIAQGEDNSIVFGSKATQARQKIFWDGFQAEFNVQAFECLGWVNDSIYLGLRSLHEKAIKHNPKSRLTIQSTLDVDRRILQDAKEEHVQFGCMPSFNIYDMQGIKEDGRNVDFRSAGGHIHFGLAKAINNGKDQKKIERYVKTLDKILGVACVSLFEKYDDARRREMYGLAGEYRLPPHGLEYRTLSNAWLSHPLITNMVLELSRKCISLVDVNKETDWNATEEETIQCINNCDVELAREILARNKDVFVSILYSISYSMTFEEDREQKAENQYKIYMLGLNSIIKNPDDVLGNWGLNKVWRSHCSGAGFTISNMSQNPKYATLKDEKVTEIYEELVKEIDSIGLIEKAVGAAKKLFKKQA